MVYTAPLSAGTLNALEPGRSTSTQQLGGAAQMRRYLPMLMGLIWGCTSAETRPSPKTESQRPQSFVEIRELAPTILVEARYSGIHNFIGEPIDGYEASNCLLTRAAAEALARAQAELKPTGLSLKTYDCYRPQRGVNHFVSWAADPKDRRMKTEFYPNEDKGKLFERGYIARRSGHSRGSTVDLTLVRLPAAPQPTFEAATPQVECHRPAGERYPDNSLDMGTGYDCFSVLSHTANPKIGEEQRANRQLLEKLLEKHGFKNYSKEWWHYSLKDEPYPRTFFDFPVR